MFAWHDRRKGHASPMLTRLGGVFISLPAIGIGMALDSVGSGFNGLRDSGWHFLSYPVFSPFGAFILMSILVLIYRLIRRLRARARLGTA